MGVTRRSCALRLIFVGLQSLGGAKLVAALIRSFRRLWHFDHINMFYPLVWRGVCSSSDSPGGPGLHVPFVTTRHVRRRTRAPPPQRLSKAVWYSTPDHTTRSTRDPTEHSLCHSAGCLDSQFPFREPSQSSLESFDILTFARNEGS